MLLLLLQVDVVLVVEQDRLFSQLTSGLKVGLQRIAVGAAVAGSFWLCCSLCSSVTSAVVGLVIVGCKLKIGPILVCLS